MGNNKERASGDAAALAPGLLPSALWEAGAPPDLTPGTRLDRLANEVLCVAPTDTVALYWRFFAPRQRLRFVVNLAAEVLNNFPQGRAHFPEPLDLLHGLAFRYTAKDKGGRLYRWEDWQLDSQCIASPGKSETAARRSVPPASCTPGDSGATPRREMHWLKYVFFRLIGQAHFGPLASLASKPGWTPPTETIHRPGDGGKGPDSDGAAEDIEFSDDSDSLDQTFTTAMPQALQLTGWAVTECAAAKGFGANSGKAEAVFFGLYFEAQTPAEVVRKTGAKRDFVKLMEDVAWLDSTLRRHCRPATIDAIVNAISFRARK